MSADRVGSLMMVILLYNIVKIFNLFFNVCKGNAIKNWATPLLFFLFFYFYTVIWRLKGL